MLSRYARLFLATSGFVALASLALASPSLTLPVDPTTNIVALYNEPIAQPFAAGLNSNAFEIDLDTSLRIPVPTPEPTSVWLPIVALILIALTRRTRV